MKVNKLFLTIALTLIASVSFAQTIKVSGQVTDITTGEPVAFANLMVVGTTTGTATDIDGMYAIDADKNASLIFSMIGYDDITVPVNGQAKLNVQMNPSTTFLEEAVVSALGITRAAKSLTYSAETVNSEELTTNKTANMIQSLAGKAAGITITNSASGMGGSSKVSIRGYRSTSSNNPLIVINGIPVGTNGTDGGGGMLGSANASTDSGDALGTINPDDIESMSILKGASASALYGTEAANGIILITTKKGKAGQFNVTYNNTSNFESVAYYPQLQKTYGTSSQMKCWGSKLAKEADILFDNLFQTAPTITNSISVSGGSEKNQTFLSYANTYAQGVLKDGNSTLNRHNITFRNTTKFGEKFTVDASVQFTNSNRKNPNQVNGQYLNPIYSAYIHPTDGDWKYYRDNYEVYDSERNMMVQNWYDTTEMLNVDNPWWLMNKIDKLYRTNKVVASATLRYDINPHVYVQARGGFNYEGTDRETKISATTSPGLIYSNNGRYTFGIETGTKYYGDVLAGYSNEWGKFGLVATVGAAVNFTNGDWFEMDSGSNGVEGLYYPNIFSYNNVIYKNGSAGISSGSELLGVFATVTASFDNWLFLDVTGRNDWSSALANSTSFKSGYFYPSVGLSAALNEAFNMGPAVDLLKLRASYAKVGNGLPAGVTNPTGSIDGNGNASPNTTAPYGELKPELSASWEVGGDFRFFGNRLNLDLTFYKTNSTNQLMRIPAASGSKYNYYYVNAGNIENKGFEVTLGFVPVETKSFTWRSTFTGSSNKNTVLELAEGMDRIMLVDGQNQELYQYLEVGGSYGDIYGKGFQRNDDGSLILNDQGLPMKSTDLMFIGNPTPKFRLGWNNSFEIGNVNVSFLIDSRFGGKVLSMTQAGLDAKGLSQQTVIDREKGYVEFEGHKFTDVEGFYKVVAEGNGIKEHYMRDATNIRLRELSVGYSFPKAWFGKGLKGIDLAITGRNLFFFYNAAPYDPDSSISTGDSYEGMDIWNTPATRSCGFNIKLTF